MGEKIWTVDVEELTKLYDDFQKKFPMDKLKKMTLDEYSNTNKESFCYWVETKTRKLGSIQGATSYKFGIYRYVTDPRIGNGYAYDEEYAWLSKYGSTVEEAYNRIHGNIILVADFAQKGDFDAIEKVDISPMFKWKIAFLYSNRRFLNFFAEEGIRYICKQHGMENYDKTTFAEMYIFLLALNVEHENLFIFSSRLWNEWLIYQNEEDKKRKFWSGGIKWGEEDKFNDFSKNNYWQIGWDILANSKGARQAWQNIKNVRVGDYLAFHGYGGSNDLRIYQISKVLDKDEVTGKLLLEKINEENDILFHGKAPKMDKGSWFGTLFQVTGEEAINTIFGNYIQGDPTMQGADEKLKEYVDLLKSTKNLILTGAPGTGKTHLAKKIAEDMGCTTKEIGFVQFHPSYDYTDFVEGLRPVQDESGSGQIGFERKDGVFKEFCERALKNLQNQTMIDTDINSFDTAWNYLTNEVRENIANGQLTKIGIWEYSLSSTGSLKYSSKDTQSKYTFTITKQNVFDAWRGIKARPSGYYQKYMKEVSDYMKKFGLSDYNPNKPLLNNKIKSFVFIIDEINRGEVAKIFGELFYSVDPGYRVTAKDIEEAKSEQKTITTIRTQYANLEIDGNAFDNALNIVDENDYGHFFVPENVYIIGTMNDIDRSVESMDFAFRRRFAWAEVRASDTMGMLDPGTDENGNPAGTGLESSDLAKEAKERMVNLNRAISEDFGPAYEIGASYFLKLNQHDGDFEKLWQYHIKGILEEYLRGHPEKTSLMEKFRAAYFSKKATIPEGKED